MAGSGPRVTLDPEIRGDTWTWTLTIINQDTGAPFADLAGCAITCTIGGVPGWSGAADSGEIVVTDAVNGVITVTVPASATAAFAPGIYPGDLELITATGDTRTPILFALPVLPDVTRS